jgi:hypothetical protein
VAESSENIGNVEYLSWTEVDALIDHLLPQLKGPYDALVMVTRGGIIPGGIVAEALDIRRVDCGGGFSAGRTAHGSTAGLARFSAVPQRGSHSRAVCVDRG